MLCCGASFASEDFFLSDQAVPSVLTASRLQNSAAAAPGSITVIDQQMIQSLDAPDFSALMVLVPGMMFSQSSRHQVGVSYHSVAPGQQRRILVLIDGQAAYRSALGKVDWLDIPISVDDIERIEVFRGPNTLSYGANAMTAVINIFTKQARFASGTQIKVKQGTDSDHSHYLRLSHSWDSGGAWLSTSGMRNQGFFADESQRDAFRLNKLHFKLEQELNPLHSFTLHLAANEGSQQEDQPLSPKDSRSALNSKLNTKADRKNKDYSGSLKWTYEASPDHSLALHSSIMYWERFKHWDVCYASSDYLTPSLSSSPYACGRTNGNSRELRYDLELQDTYSINPSMRLISGINLRKDQASSVAYLSGQRNKYSHRLFAQLEWQLDQHWLLQGGAVYEHDNLHPSTTTPRLALNYLITPSQGLRAVYSEAMRSADMFERFADWRIQVKHRTDAQGLSLAPDYLALQARGNPVLKKERMRSYELGYHAQLTPRAMELDLKLFHDQISDPIYSSTQIENFRAYNGRRIVIKGAELEHDWQLNADNRVRTFYAYLDSTDYNLPTRQATPRHSGGISWYKSWPQQWSSGVTYLGHAGANSKRSNYSQVNLSKQLNFSKVELKLSSTLRYLLSSVDRNETNRYLRDRHQVYFSAEMEF